MNKLQINPNPDVYKHDYIVLSEYVSTGKNLLGVKVKAKYAKVECTKCGEDNIQFVEKL